MGGGVLAALTLLTLVPQLGSLVEARRNNDPRLAIYRRVGDWLKGHTPADASVGALEVGIIGYYAERRMIDFAGLIQPETAQRMARATTYEDAAIWAFHRFRPDYLVLQDGLFPRLEHDPAVRGCRQIGRWTERGYSHQLIAYRCAS